MPDHPVMPMTSRQSSRSATIAVRQAGAVRILRFDRRALGVARWGGSTQIHLARTQVRTGGCTGRVHARGDTYLRGSG